MRSCSTLPVAVFCSRRAHSAFRGRSRFLGRFTLLVAAFIIYGELISANNSAFLTKKIEGELDRIDEVCAVPKQDTTDKPLATDGFDLAMEHVSFGYGDGRRVIDGVSLRIPEGSTCALIGRAVRARPRW